MNSVPNSSQNEPQSFEISQWFSSILNRIDNIQIHQKYQNKWRNLALKLKQKKRIARVMYVQYKYRQKKNSRNSKSNWLLFYSKLYHRKKKKLFNIAKKQLLDAKQKAEDLRRAKNILMIPETEYESEGNNNSNLNSNYPSCPLGLNTDQYDNLTPNAQKWVSMSQRFLSQTKYNELSQAYQNYLDELKSQKQERKNLWQDLANILIWNIKKKRIKTCHRKFKQARENWNFLYSNCILVSKLNQIKKVHSKWNSLSLKTDSQIRSYWNRFYFSLRFKQNIIRMVRESSALSTLTNFFRYIILIRRSTAVAKYFPIRYVANIRSMIKESTYDSADKIRKFVSMKVVRDNDIFALNWSNCIAEAFSSVASHQVGPPNACDQQKRRIKASPKVHKKPSNNLNNLITIQTNPVSQKQDEQEPLNYPIKIIKITRDFDPNEEGSDREINTYFSDSNESSDGGSGKPKGFRPHSNDLKSNNDKFSYTEIKNIKNEPIVIITSPKEKAKENGCISIEINPSGSQSAGTVEESENNNTDDNNEKQIKRNKDYPINDKLKPIQKKKRKQKELYAPIVIPKGKKKLSPIKKKRLFKPLDEEVHNPSINDILNIVGIDSSLELLDEGSSSDNSNSSGIHFRFDDDLSEPNAEPLKDLVVDLINITTSDEERRIRQSLLEASQASSNPPYEDDKYKKLPKLKDEKIDLLDPSNNNIINDEVISASPSYNSNSESVKEKDFSENKNNVIENDQILIEEEEEDEIAAMHSSIDKKTDIMNDIKMKTVEDDDDIAGLSMIEKKTDLLNDIEMKKEEEDIGGLIEEEENSCQFNFESEKQEDKNPKKMKTNSSSLNEQKSLNGPSDSYISDRDVDAAMNEYSSEDAAK